MVSTAKLSRQLSRLASLQSGLLSTLAKIPVLLVPNTCLTCDNFVVKQGGCCASCWQKLRFVRKPLCPVLGSPFSVDMGEDFLCAEAIANPPPFERLRTVVVYDDLARKLVAGLKYADRSDLAPWIADWMRVAGSELVDEADFIIPVPLHRARLRSRRFNQAAEISRRIAKTSQRKYLPEGLLRRRKTRQQVGLSQSQRERNVSGAFAVPAAMQARLKGKRVLIVDDVYTTGATARAATRALKRNGVAEVDVLVFAKVETRIS